MATYPAAVCICGDCTPCEFAEQRRIRKVRAQDPTPSANRATPRKTGGTAPSAAPWARALAIAAKTGMPIQQVNEALREGRTEADLLALAG